jgi:hypothetical protein
MYTVDWFFAVTSVADGCAINWGDTWSNFEVFNFFIPGNAMIALPLLAPGIFSTLIIQKYL